MLEIIDDADSNEIINDKFLSLDDLNKYNIIKYLKLLSKDIIN